MSYPDDSRDEPGKRPPDGQTEPDLPFDEDAAWRGIVENFGERAPLGEGAAAGTPAEPGPSPAGPVGTNRFDRSYLDSLDAPTPGPRDAASASWSDEGHFVPPEPPPVPGTTPARRLAWFGLFGAPTLMLLAVIGGWSYPTWFSMVLVAAFVGGFVFLVATMERRGGDGWGGDDGAVV
jgi:hypothetical protein